MQIKNMSGFLRISGFFKIFKNFFKNCIILVNFTDK